MNRLLLTIFAVALSCLGLRASTVISGTLSITNYAALTNATSGQSYTLNSDTRTFTNSVASAATQIRVLTNHSAATILLSLAAQAGSYPFANVLSMTTSGGTNITFRATNDTALTITLNPTNWGVVTYSTQTVGTAQTVVRVPLSAEESSAQTNIASLLWTGLDAYSQTRSLGAVDFTGAITAAGSADFAGRVALDAGLGLHGRYLVATNYTLTTNDLYLGVDTRSNTNLILTLPSAASASNLLFILKDEGGAGATNTLKIYPATGDRIDTLLTNLVVSNNFGGVQLRSRGSTNWAVLASGGGVSGSATGDGGAGGVWVSKSGSDSTGTRGDVTKPFLTLGAAKTNALSGDTIFVMPGTYDEKNLLKTGVNWHFFRGAKVIYTGAEQGAIFEDDSDGANTNIISSITGYGEFDNQGSAADSVLYCRRISTISLQGLSATADWFVVDIGNPGPGTNTVTLSDLTINGTDAYPLYVNNSNAVVTLNRCKLVSTDLDQNGTAIEFSTVLNTNTILRDCVLIGNASASSPVAIRSTVAGTSVRIVGTFHSNLGFHANVAYVYDEDLWYAAGIHLPTNSVPFNIDTTDFVLDTNYTNGTQRAWVSAPLLLSANASDTAQVALYLDQDADTAFEQTGMTATATGLATNTIPLGAFIQPGGVFIFTNLSTGSATAAVNTGGSQWVKQ